jgi:two-component system response regulator (stage 0 sporulation protein A)
MEMKAVVENGVATITMSDKEYYSLMIKLQNPDEEVKPYSCNSSEQVMKFNSNVTVNLKSEIMQLLSQLGMPAHVKGFDFNVEAITLAMGNKGYIREVTKKLYPEIAVRFNTTPSRTERAIRHSIEVAWSRGNVDLINSLFGYAVNANKGKPTNSEFIATLVNHLSVSMGKSECEGNPT